jgi:hypothetical protein
VVDPENLVSLPISFIDLPASSYPFTVEYVSVASGKTLRTDTVTDAGMLQVPGRNFFGEAVTIRITFANGEVREAT